MSKLHAYMNSITYNGKLQVPLLSTSEHEDAPAKNSCSDLPRD